MNASNPEPGKPDETAGAETRPMPAEPRPVPAEPRPMPKEIGGPPGPEPTRYGDWEHKGRCTDF